MAASGEQFSSSGQFDERGPQSKEETMDLDIFAKPKGPGDDATVEDIFQHDPVADSQAVWQETQDAAAAAAEAAKAVETPDQAALAAQAAQAQADVDDLFNPAINPPEPTPGSAPVQQVQAPVVPAVPGAAPVVPQVPGVPTAPDELALLRAQNQALQNQMAQFLQAPPQVPQAQPVPQPAAATYAQQQVGVSSPGHELPGVVAPAVPEPLPNYNYNIAPELVSAIQSEDPGMAARGLSALVAEVANAVHTQVRQEYRGYVQQQVPQLATNAVQHQQGLVEARKSLREDFFGTYPQFGEAQKTNPLDPVIQSVTGEVMRDLGFREWNDVVKNTVAYRLHTMFNGGQQVAPVQGGGIPVIPGVPTLSPAQAALAAPGTRAGGGREANPALKEHYEVADLFFGGGDHPTGSF